MPEMDGYTAAQLIRQQLKLTTPVVAMTAHVLAGEKEKCIGYGMNDYISKPIKEKELLGIITRYITSYKPAAVEKNFVAADSFAIYKCINLQYMQQVSNGNKEYEKTVTEHFIEIIPQNIATLENALDANDFDTIKLVAHNMKTTVSVMGLTQALQPFLDTLEFENYDETILRENISSVKKICVNALEDANTFYASL